MKYLKTYEEKRKKPKIGEYAVMNFKYYDEEWANYINSNVGKILEYDTEYKILYEVTDEIIKKSFNEADKKFVVIINNKKYIRMTARIDEIIFHSKNKEDCEAFIVANKFNL